MVDEENLFSMSSLDTSEDTKQFVLGYKKKNKMRKNVVFIFLIRIKNNGSFKTSEMLI